MEEKVFDERDHPKGKTQELHARERRKYESVGRLDGLYLKIDMNL